MGFVIHYLNGLGGAGHTKFSIRLLKRYGKEQYLEEYVALAIKNSPRHFSAKLSTFLSSQ